MVNNQIKKQLKRKIDKMSVEEMNALYAKVGGYEFIPVDIDTFLTDKNYLGNYFDELKHPAHWVHHFKQIYPSPFYSPYWFIVFRGAIGTAKSTYAAAIIAYEVYKLLCLRDIQRTLKRVPASVIMFALFNITLDTAGDFWGKLETMMVESPFFNTLMNPSGRRGGTPLFKKGIDFRSGSRLTHSIGKDVYSAVLDEANFEIIKGQTKENFNSLIRRMQSRFGDGDKLPGKIFLISSETDSNGIVDTLLTEYKGQSGIYVAGSSLWEVWPERYPAQKHFKVYKGSESKQPRMITTDSDPIVEMEPEAILKVPDLKTVRAAFEADIGAALRDLAGIATTSEYYLFGQRDKLEAAFQMSSLFPDIIELSFDDDIDQIASHCSHPKYFAKPLHPHSPRHIHIDIALTGDKLGIAGSYVREFVTVEIDNPITLEVIQESLPNIVTEWAFSIKAKAGEQIPLYKIRLFVKWLAKLGYKVEVITADGFQSADMIQGFTKWGYKAELLSMDKTAIPYVTARNAIYEGRAILPLNMLLKKEMRALLLSPDGKKVDHPDKFPDNTVASKDVADAACGSIVSLLSRADEYRISFMRGEDYSMSNEMSETFWPDRF